MSRPPLVDINSKTGLIGLGSIPSKAPVASFNIDGIHNLIETNSILAYHIRACPNPDRETLAGPVNPNEQVAHRGKRFYSIRPLGVVPQQFKLDDRLMAQGVWGRGSAIFNVTGTYVDNGPDKTVYIRNGDLIVLNETISVLTDQLLEYNPSGPQRLNYKIKGVDYLADDINEYVQERDFIIENFQIKWIDGGIKPNKIGKVLTCVYYYTPIYIVQNMPHNLRIIPSNEFGHGAFPRKAVYAPQLVIVTPSTLIEENNVLDWFEVPALPDYPDTTGNTTGGSV